MGAGPIVVLPGDRVDLGPGHHAAARESVPMSLSISGPSRDERRRDGSTGSAFHARQDLGGAKFAAMPRRIELSTAEPRRTGRRRDQRLPGQRGQPDRLAGFFTDHGPQPEFSVRSRPRPGVEE